MEFTLFSPSGQLQSHPANCFKTLTRAIVNAKDLALVERFAAKARHTRIKATVDQGIVHADETYMIKRCDEI